MAIQGDRTLLGADESVAAALDYMMEEVPFIWEFSHPLWKRWAMDPNTKQGVALAERGVHTKVVKEIDGGSFVRYRVDDTRNTSAGRQDQNGDFLGAGNAATQTISYAYFTPTLWQGWIGVGFQDKLEIQGGAAGGFNYVQHKVTNNVKALSRALAKAIYGTGFVQSAVSTANALSMQGLMLACNATNIIMTTAAAGFYGGVNRVTAANSDWRGQGGSQGSGNNGTITAALQPSDLQNAYTLAQDGNDGPTLIVCGRTPHNIMWNWYEAKQRILNNEDPTLGKASRLSFDGVSIMLDKTLDDPALSLGAGGGTSPSFYVAADAATLAELNEWGSKCIYILNENYIDLNVWKGGHGKGASPLMLPEMQSTTNLNKVYRSAWMGTLAVSRPNRQAALIDVGA